MGAKVSLEDKVRIDGEILRFPEIISKGDEKKNKRKSSENFSSRKDTDKLRKTLRGTRGNERKKAEKEIAMRSKSEDRARNVKKKSHRSNSR